MTPTARWPRTRCGSCRARASGCRSPASRVRTRPAHEETPTMERQRRRPGGPLVWIVAAGVAGLLACSTPAAAPPAGGAAPPAAQASAPPAASAANATPAAAGPSATPAQLRHFDVGVVALVSYFYPMWIALERGFWAQQGLDVELTTLQTNEAV